MAKILAICISEQKGEQKHPVDEAYLKEDWGIVGDAHAGKWHRQVSVLSQESVDELQKKLPEHRLKAGDFAENILICGLDIKTVPVGQKIKLGQSAVGEITQIGKECHQDCIIRKTAGDCVMPREGVFMRIIIPGTIRTGDNIELI